MHKPVYIVDAIRTPRGVAKEGGGLNSLASIELISQLLAALTERTALTPQQVDDVFLGCVSQYGEQAGNIARASLLYAGWPHNVPGLSLNRFCSSSLDASCLAADRIASGTASIMLAGGVESMSRVRMFSDIPAWMTDAALMEKTGLVPLGESADLIATLEGFSRADLDQYALQSQQRAQLASESGRFDKSLIAMRTADGQLFDADQTIRPQTTLQTLEQLSPAFAGPEMAELDQRVLSGYSEIENIDHQHTAGNSPAMADAASLLLIANELSASALNVAPRAEIIGFKSYCGPVELGLTGGFESAQRLLKSQSMTIDDIDLIEFNESFAGPTLKFIQDMGINDSKVNVNGGAIALGHPMGATGGILIGTVLDELERRDQEIGMVCICGASGSGTAMLIKRV